MHKIVLMENELSINDLPIQIKTQDLIESVNPDYCVEDISRHEALYGGGDKFRCFTNKLLVKRQLEENGGAFGSSHFEERKKRAWYINRAGGLIDYMAAKTVGNRPGIEVASPVDVVNDERVEFWNSLNDDCDGNGTSLVEFARRLVVDGLVHGVAWLQDDFPSDIYIPSDPETTKCVMRSIDPICMDDWGLDNYGALGWCRRHTSELIACEGEPWKRTKNEKHAWTFFTKDGIAVYEAYKREGNFDDYATLVYSAGNDFGLPVYKINYGKSQYVMARIEDVAVALFNAEADLAFSQAKAAHPQPVLETERTPESIAITSGAIMLLLPGEKLSFPNPGTAFDSQFKNIDRLKMAFYEVVHALSREAAEIPQAGRMSGETVKQLRDPFETLLTTFANPVYDAINKWIKDVAIYRGDEDLDIKLYWPEAKVDDNELEDVMGVGEVESKKGDFKDNG